MDGKMEKLVQCIDQGNLNYVKALINKLPDLNVTLIEEDDCNLNLLHITVGVESVFRDDFVNYIVKIDGLNINKPSGPGNDYFTAAHIAACSGFSTTLQILLRHGADPYLIDIDGNTVWDIASQNDHFNCILILENEINKLPPTPTPTHDESIYYSFQKLNLSEQGDSTLKDASLTLPNRAANLQGIQEKQINREVKKIDEKLVQKNGSNKTSIPSKKSSPKPLKFNNYQSFCWTKQGPDTSVYIDNEFNITLIEHEVSASSSSSHSSTLSSPNSTLVSVNSSIERLTNDELRQRLIRLGESPGPVNKYSRPVYLRYYSRINNNTIRITSPTKRTLPLPSYPQHINNIILDQFNFTEAKKLEIEFCKIFTDAKGPIDFFNYLLLDPRLTDNIPQQASASKDRKHDCNLFMKFIKSIFYVGKGKNNRPLMHLYEAVQSKRDRKSEKIKRIHEIWSQDLGVISLQVFTGMSSDEAYARESLMIDAIGIDQLTNIKSGHNNMNKLLWTDGKKMILGTYFLYKSYKSLLFNGERQIKKTHIR